MKKIDIVGIAFSNFKRRKTRSILTVLGVVIGVASIVVMISLGIAVDKSFDDQIKSIGDLTTISVRPGFDQATGKEKGALDDALVAELSKVDKVTLVSPRINLNGKLVSGKFVNPANVVGVNSAYLEKLGFKAEKGTIQGLEVASGKKYNCLVGYEVPYQFYNPKSNSRGGMGMMMSNSGNGEEREPPPVDLMDELTKLRFTFDWSYGERQQGMDITVATQKPVLYNFNTIGMLKQEMGEKDYSVYIDIEIAKKLKKEQDKLNDSQSGVISKKKNKQQYDEVKVLTASIDDTIEVTNAIKDLGYEAWSSAEYIETFKKSSQLIQLILGGIGSISLLVAAIGITNTMIMSIYERTREIGIMKVIGCQLKDIRTMFLYEASFIGLFGGAIGLVISYGLSFLLNLVGKNGMGDMGMEGGSTLSIIPPWLAILAVVFAIFVGLVAGFLPARRAMKLSALEAMRT